MLGLGFRAHPSRLRSTAAASTASDPQLEAFLERWRAELKPAHAFVFSARNGAPLTPQGVHRLFVSSCFRLVHPCLPAARTRGSVEPFLGSCT